MAVTFLLLVLALPALDVDGMDNGLRINGKLSLRLNCSYPDISAGGEEKKIGGKENLPNM